MWVYRVDVTKLGRLDSRPEFSTARFSGRGRTAVRQSLTELGEFPLAGEEAEVGGLNGGCFRLALVSWRHYIDCPARVSPRGPFRAACSLTSLYLDSALSSAFSSLLFFIVFLSVYLLLRSDHYRCHEKNYYNNDNNNNLKKKPTYPNVTLIFMVVFLQDHIRLARKFPLTCK